MNKRFFLLRGWRGATWFITIANVEGERQLQMSLSQVDDNNVKMLHAAFGLSAEQLSIEDPSFDPHQTNWV